MKIKRQFYNWYGNLLTMIFLCFLLSQAQAAPGDLDSTFGSGGKVTTDFGNDNTDTGRDVAIQPDGKIVVVGFAFNTTSNRDIAFARYNSNGSLDISFGNSGRVIVSINTDSDFCDGVAIQPDGKIVASGSSNTRTNRVVVRLNSNGTRDSTFGTNGVVSVVLGSPSSDFSDVLIQPDGKIVVSGSTKSGGNDFFSLMRFNANGTLDGSFGNNGQIVTSLLTISNSNAVTIQTDGKLIAAGASSTSTTSPSNLSLVRYNPNGTLDTTFGSDGKVVLSISGGDSSILEVAIQPDGKIVATGVFILNSNENFLVMRFNSNGSLDSTFNGNGIVSTEMGGSPERATGLILRNNKIIATGWTTSGTNTRFALARYTDDGTLDSTFGTNGKVFTDFADANDTCLNSVLQPNGKLVLVGWAQNPAPGGFDFALARYNLDNAARNNFDFDGDGRDDVAVFRPLNGVWYLDLSTQGSSATFFGLSNDILVPADYDGDGKTDIAVFRDGFWYRLNSSNGLYVVVPFGLSGDVPVPGDYNGDGKSEIAVFRSGVWYIQLNAQTVRYEYFGLSMDKPLPGDYDGDGKTDLAVFRRADSTWYLQRSSRGFAAIKFGISSDKPVVGDYNGDGKTDIAVWRPETGIWYKLEGENFDSFSAFHFGLAGDIPIPADYDGDGKTDIAVWRSRTWYLQRSRDGFAAFDFGILNDKPIPAAFIP